MVSNSTLTVTTSATIGDVTISNGALSTTNASGFTLTDNISTSGNITGNDVIVNGNLTVSGTTTTLNTETVTVKDPLMVLSSGATSGASDSGLLIDRGTDSNVGFIWDESSDHFAVVNTTDTDNTTSNVTITSYSDLKVNKLLVGDEELTGASLNSINDIIGATAGTLSSSKAIVVDANKNINEFRTSALYLGVSGSETEVTSSGAELNLLDGTSSGSIVNGKAVIYGAAGQLNTTKLQINSLDVDANATEINILSGVTGVTANNINHLSNLTQNVQAAITARYTSTHIDDNFSAKTGSTSIVTTGALNAGSITSGFGDINIGTTNSLSAGSLTIDNIVIDGAKIGHSDDIDLMVLSNGKVNVKGIADIDTLHLGGVAISSTAAHINKLATVTSSDAELNILDGVTGVTSAHINRLSSVTYDINTKFGEKLDSTTAATTYAGVNGSGTFTTVGHLAAGSIASTFGNINIGTSDINAGSATIDNVIINTNTIGHTDNTNLLTLTAGSLDINKPVNVTGKLSATQLKLGGTDVTASAAKINLSLIHI